MELVRTCRYFASLVPLAAQIIHAASTETVQIEQYNIKLDGMD